MQQGAAWQVVVGVLKSPYGWDVAAAAAGMWWW